MPQPTQLDSWLKDFPRGEAEARIRELESELAGLRNALVLYDSLTGDSSTPPDGRPANRPVAIRRILRERGNEPMLPKEIKDIMLEREWMDPDDLKYFYSAMSNMTKRKHLLRLKDNRYVLSPRWAGGDVM